MTTKGDADERQSAGTSSVNLPWAGRPRCPKWVKADFRGTSGLGKYCFKSLFVVTTKIFQDL
jgi:hypothetical protein